MQVSGSRYLSSFPLLHILSPSSQHFSGLKILAGGAPFYDVYTCKDGGIFSVGCLEPQFFRAFIERFVPEVEKVRKGDGWIPSTETQSDFSEWPKMRQYFQQGFMTQDRDFWAKVFHGKSLRASMHSTSVIYVNKFSFSIRCLCSSRSYTRRSSES